MPALVLAAPSSATRARIGSLRAAVAIHDHRSAGDLVRQPPFDDGAWQRGNAAASASLIPRVARVGTPWQTPDIWLRRTFDMPSPAR